MWPYPIYDQNQRFFLPYLRPAQKFDTLFMTIAAGRVAPNIIFEGLFYGLIANDERVVSSKTRTQFKTRAQKSYLIQDQNG